MPEFNGETRANTIFPKGEDAVESSDLLRASYLTGTDEITSPPNPHAFKGGLNLFENDAELRAAAARRPSPRPPT